MFRRKFGRKTFGGRSFRRGPRYIARQYRTYETLLTDNYGFQGNGDTIGNAAARGLLFPTGINGAWSFDETDETGIANFGLPQLGQGQQATEPLPRNQTCGFTALLPLWNWEMYEYHGRDISLKALKGYLLPTAVSLFDTTGAPSNTGDIVKVRMALLSLDAGVAASWSYGLVTGTGANNPIAQQQRQVIPFNVFAFEDFNKHRMWWYRDWYMPINQNIYTYWAPGAVAPPPAVGSSFFEPKLGSVNGAPTVKLGRRFGSLMRMTKDRWPFLAIGVAGAYAQEPTLTTGNGHGGRTLQPLTALGLVFNGDLRAFLTR